jgi:hypothetical protein
MKVWISKYALAQGIYEAEVDRYEDSQMVTIQHRYGCEYFHGEGREWHMTREEAVARAEAMRAKKIASLKKQIAKLEKLVF